MNLKKAKKLRKEIGYRPSDKRVYNRNERGVVEIDAIDKRSLYKEMKKELK